MTKYYPEGTLINTESNKYYLESEERLREAAQKGILLEGRAVVCDCEHNLHIDLKCMRGIIPRLECAVGIEEGVTRDIAIISKVNKPVCFYITDFTTLNGKKVAVLSRRAVQEEFSKKCLELAPGDIIDAVVTHLENFGAFCDIGCGVTSLLPIDSISISRIPHPSARLAVGDKIRAIVKNFDEKNRITLSHKELLGTWTENAEMFEVGETVSGIVRSIEDYGIFVELTPNLAGLAETEDNVSAGDTVSVYIKSIIPEKIKIKLVIINVFKEDFPVKKPKYFYEGNRIDYFRYTPEKCDKLIETFFT
ncbi:MAG TPA: S1 RNA-binding domain-containing protein [Oscillospiraceae bacterium]|nr:S1 RNA-binding domain-containing protein [Oscillospiraceae bacterium]